MDFSVTREMGPRWVFIPLALGLIAFFAYGLSNSILFYEMLPKDLNAEIIVFYQPTCPHCIAEIPTIKKLVAEGYSISAFNVLKRQDLAKKFGITATPTIIVTGTGKKLEGEQSYETIVSVLKGAQLPAWMHKGASCSTNTEVGTCSPT